MTAALKVESDRRKRFWLGRLKYGEEFVTTDPHGALGEAYQETLDCLNYLDQITRSLRIIAAGWFVRMAARIIAAEIMDREAQG